MRKYFLKLFASRLGASHFHNFTLHLSHYLPVFISFFLVFLCLIFAILIVRGFWFFGWLLLLFSCFFGQLRRSLFILNFLIFTCLYFFWRTRLPLILNWAGWRRARTLSILPRVLFLMTSSSRFLHFWHFCYLSHVQLICRSLHCLIQIQNFYPYLSSLNFVILRRYFFGLLFGILLFLSCDGSIISINNFLFLWVILKLLVFEHLLHLVCHVVFVFSSLARSSDGDFEIFLFLLRCFLRLSRRFNSSLNSIRSNSMQ